MNYIFDERAYFDLMVKKVEAMVSYDVGVDSLPAMSSSLRALFESTGGVFDVSLLDESLRAEALEFISTMADRISDDTLSVPSVTLSKVRGSLVFSDEEFLSCMVNVEELKKNSAEVRSLINADIVKDV